jgi:hypothetical protein
VLRSRVAVLDLRDLDLEVVGLRDRLDGDGARVVLEAGERSKQIVLYTDRWDWKLEEKSVSTYRVGEESAESHFCEFLKWSRNFAEEKRT